MDADKLSVPTTAVLVNEIGNDTLARARFSGQNNCAVGLAHRAYFIKNLAHDHRIGSQQVQRFIVPELVAQIIRF